VEEHRLHKDSNVKGIPLLMGGDIERTYKIYGQHPEYLKDKLVKKTMGQVPVDMMLCKRGSEMREGRRWV